MSMPMLDAHTWMRQALMATFYKIREALMSGDFAEAVVTGSDEYDLIGELYEEHESAE